MKLRFAPPPHYVARFRGRIIQTLRRAESRNP